MESFTHVVIINASLIKIKIKILNEVFFIHTGRKEQKMFC